MYIYILGLVNGSNAEAEKTDKASKEKDRTPNTGGSVIMFICYPMITYHTYLNF